MHPESGPGNASPAGAVPPGYYPAGLRSSISENGDWTLQR